MSSRTLLSLAMTYSVLAIAAVLFLFVLYVLGYVLIYRKLMKGQKSFPYNKLLWLGCLLFYAIVVLGATILFRFPSTEPEPIYPLFYSYRDAWIAWSIISWRNIILNFCMCIPLGILLPLGIEKMRSFWKVFIAGFSFSLMIELTQLLSHRGMFEPDDLLGNTTGALIGYGFFLLGDQLIRRIKKRPTHKRSAVFFAQLPLIMTMLVFTIIFTKYHFMKLGVHPNTPLNMPSKKLLTVNSSVDFSSDDATAMVYYQKPLTATEAISKGEAILKRLGGGVSESATRRYENEVFLFSEDDTYTLTVSYRSGTYHLTNYKLLFPDEYDTEEQAQIVTGATAEEAIQWLEKAGIEIDPSGIFEERENGWYRFTYKMVPAQKEYLNGTID
ncbi:MAG: VanZ family protein, partial [Lachnospiraceae bacterium]|nr:VanZ family protein [Lachnospiraceae bacterium]